MTFKTQSSKHKYRNTRNTSRLFASTNPEGSHSALCCAVLCVLCRVSSLCAMYVARNFSRLMQMHFFSFLSFPPSPITLTNAAGGKGKRKQTKYGFQSGGLMFILGSKRGGLSSMLHETWSRDGENMCLLFFRTTGTKNAGVGRVSIQKPSHQAFFFPLLPDTSAPLPQLDLTFTQSYRPSYTTRSKRRQTRAIRPWWPRTTRDYPHPGRGP